MSTTEDIELEQAGAYTLLDPVPDLPPNPRHRIFLSHSGAQKNFVEQLCLDLELHLHHTPFFDKRPESLPKGEVFAHYIFAAAQQCELAIVVVSEEYFSRRKWPMLELAALVHTGRCRILPLFLGLSCAEFKEAERRERWYRKWEDWAQKDPRVRVGDWKLAVRELDRRNGLEYVAAVGEVGFRKEVLAVVADILPEWVEVEKEEVLLSRRQSFFEGPFFEGLKNISKVICRIIGFIALTPLFFFVFFKFIVPIFEFFIKDFLKDRI